MYLRNIISTCLFSLSISTAWGAPIHQQSGTHIPLKHPLPYVHNPNQLAQQVKKTHRNHATPNKRSPDTPFITLWHIKRSHRKLHLPLVAGLVYNFDIDWGDSSPLEHHEGDNIKTIDHYYKRPGEYEITIYPNSQQGFPALFMGSSQIKSTDRSALQAIEQWGKNHWLTMQAAFAKCPHLDVTATDQPNLTLVYNAAYMFAGDRQLQGNKQFNQWHTDSINNMEGMFEGALQFNQPLNQWNTQHVTNMKRMFRYADHFNQALDHWNTSHVRNMAFMFAQASDFNAPLNQWSTSNVRTMRGMFRFARSFNQPLNQWQTTHVHDMSEMFRGASHFDQSLNSWDTHRVKTMEKMFQSAWHFNGTINQWDTAHVHNMHAMFRGAVSFNRPLNHWDTHNVHDMSGMFTFAEQFNQPINHWQTQHVTDMSNMFQQAKSFNQPLNHWDTSHVRNMTWMFEGARNFNQPLNNWQTAQVKSFKGLFLRASSFDQSLKDWSIRRLSKAQHMLRGSNMNCKHYSELLRAWAHKQPLPNQVTLGAGHIHYKPSAQAAHKRLTSSQYGDWTIHDGGLIQS